MEAMSSLLSSSFGQAAEAGVGSALGSSLGGGGGGGSATMQPPTFPTTPTLNTVAAGIQPTPAASTSTLPPVGGTSSPTSIQDPRVREMLMSILQQQRLAGGSSPSMPAAASILSSMGG